MKIKLFLSAAICLSLSNITFANNVDLCATKIQAGLYTDAVPYCEKACNLDEGSGCSNLGLLYDEGQGVKQNYQQAKTYYEKACNLNNGASCFYLGHSYFNKQNYQQAKTYYEKACNLNYGESCGVLGVLYATGRGVRQNKRTAKEYFGKACDLGDQLCCDEYRRLNEQGY